MSLVIRSFRNGERFEITHPITRVGFIVDAARKFEFIDSFLPLADSILFV